MQFAKQRTTGYSKERKINTFAVALEVKTDVLLGQFPPQHLATLYNSFMLDRRNKKRWKLENIALTVFDLSKHVNDWVEARKPRRIGSAVDAFRVMYQHFDNIVTWKIQERRSHKGAVSCRGGAWLLQDSSPNSGLCQQSRQTRSNGWIPNLHSQNNCELEGAPVIITRLPHPHPPRG